MDKFTKRVAYLIPLLVGALLGAGFGLAAYLGDRGAELADRLSFGEWRLPLVILAGFVWGVPAVLLHYNVARCRMASKQVEGHLIPTTMMPIFMTLSFGQIFWRDASPILFYLSFGMIHALLGFGWSYVLNQRLKA